MTATLEGVLDLDAPRGVLTEAKLDVLRKQNSSIITELRSRDEDARRGAFFRELGRDPDHWREFETRMEERAGIMENDGGLM